MNKFLKHLFGCTLVLLIVANAQAAPAELDDPAALETFVDGVIRPLMKANNSPSGTVTIAKGGQVLLAKGYGFEDIAEQVPVDAYETLFRPGSVSKLFTWVSVMQLVEQGKLDLDADVNDYLTDFKIKETFDEPITLRHIMTHTPGFEDGGLGYLIVDDPELILPLSETMKLYQPERVNPPGVQTAYSNYATSLAGLIVEIVSGVPFNDYVKQNIFDPLGMTKSSFEEPLPAELEARMATSYKPELGAYAAKDFEIIANFAPAGAQSATSPDMVRFAQAILNGGELDGNRILKAETVAEMLTPNFTHDERTTPMLLGFYETDYNGHSVVGHGGDTIYFHSYLGIDQAEDLVFFVSFASSGGSTVRSMFAPALYDRYFPRSESPPTPPEDFLERGARYAGSYGFWRGNFSKIEKAFSMGSAIQVAPTEDNTLLLAFAGGAKQYVEVEDNLFRELDPNMSLIAGISPRLVAFQENEAGAITGFVMDGLPFMSARKLSVIETANFNYSLLGLSLVILLAVALRRWFQRRELALLGPAERVAFNASFYAAAAHLLTVIVGITIVSIIADNLINGFPLSFKVWLIMPIIATLSSIYLLYRTIGVWKDKLFASVWVRVRYTFVALAGLFLAWFYYYWNILGFQYMV
ncbi:MAG: beta-lactamase family protein [Gammaproteobacteria bacterium]|nr:beta-lactamase family protein [Gammaproteobacteria bacterium]MDH5239991.1 beta-lactamase family protein [Gammaproteobacteria bacterium]MDH5260659.1 beta-lactamase family protein [Gammaproteobacteria bacterium]MDH5582821.1 beta-lactamase family protein [Gammaproteobacteria bacterium]